MDQRAHQLIDRIYAAALEPRTWQEVTEQIGELLGGASAMMSFVQPDETPGEPRYAFGIADEFRDAYVECLYRDLPWSTRYVYEFTERWRPMGEVLGHIALTDTPFYTEWLKPQGLAGHWPLGHTVVDEQGKAVAGFSAFRHEGGGAFTEEEIAAVDALVPHLRRALQLQITFHGAQSVRLALAEAIDRLPTGLLLLDAKRRVVVQNSAAERIVAAGDGFGVDRNGPAVDDARENATLQRRIADALEANVGAELSAAAFVSVSRPSGERSYAVMVTPLLAPPDGVEGQAVVAVFVADPSASVAAGAEALVELYQLTHSEAELVRLLAGGMSLEEAAERRGVSLNTARSHLKHAFAKTGTSRQGELVRLIISGVGQIQEG